MKILFITPYITIESNPQFTRNKTGFGYMVYDIVKYVAQTQQVDLFAAMVFTDELRMDGFRVLSWKPIKFISGFKLTYLMTALNFLQKYKLPFKERLRVIFQFCSLGYIEKIVGSYDVVHIHGCSPLTEAAILCCKRKQVPCVTTLHGLLSFEKVVELHPSLKKYEKFFLAQSQLEQRHVTFISSGNYNTVCNYLGTDNLQTFYVVQNGCNVLPMNPKSDIRERYGISKKDFLLLCIGNISRRKNQIQIARAYNLLPDELKGCLKVMFVGKNDDEYTDLVEYIELNNLSEKLIVCGGVEKNNIGDYYCTANATVLASISEGFGLSIIEGFVYGLPNLTYSDLPAVADLYNENAMLCVEERTDTALSQAIIQVVKKDWNREFISKYSKNFSFEDMAVKYVNIYRQIQRQIEQ